MESNYLSSIHSQPLHLGVFKMQNYTIFVNYPNKFTKIYSMTVKNYVKSYMLI